MSAEARPPTPGEIVSLTKRTVIWVAASIAMAFLAITVAMVTVFIAYQGARHDVQNLSVQSACRSQLAANVDIAIGAEVIEISDLIAAVANQDREDVARQIGELHNARDALTNALDQRAHTADICDHPERESA